MTYKLNPEIGKIVFPVIFVFSDGLWRTELRFN